jgi:hypothetical protein
MTYQSKTGETYRYKSDAVIAALSADASLAQWYRDEHGVDADWLDTLTASNCNTYGLGAHGDLCDMILADAGISYVSAE